MSVIQTIFVKAGSKVKPDAFKNAIGCIMLKGYYSPMDGTEGGALDIAAKIMGEAKFNGGEVVAVEEWRNGNLFDSYLFDSPVYVRGINVRGRIL